MEEEEAQYTTIEYQTTIKKGGRGVGFGMVAAQDATGIVCVKKITHPGQAKPIISCHDVVVGIGDESIAGWPMSRVVDRLSDYRVPIGSTVKFRLKRKFKDGGDEEEKTTSGEQEGEQEEAQERKNGWTTTTDPRGAADEAPCGPGVDID
jgi:C-terminal processing protease CtpA/Prc